ncbi:MAG: DUF6444 domain-containing protein [Pseudomonadota bacterium]|nr:DUF6444 domain-containing protein [Pseudomonadota bacterium]
MTELRGLRALVAEQAAVIEQQRQRIEELQARLAKDSHNSSKPPSSDPPFNKPPPRSQRKPSGRKPGGQKGHRGVTVPAPQVAQFQARYDTILTEAEARNPRRPRRPGTRGRVKQSPAYNLIARLREHRDAVLRFISDLRIPFDNNLAERDIRMSKLKQKVSGCFRAEAGAEHFAIIRSYLSTLRKQSADIFKSLVLTFQGSPPMANQTRDIA